MAKVQPFNPSSDDVESWTSVLTNYLLVADVDKNKVADKAKATAILLSSVGVATYSLIKDLVSPKPPESMDYDDLVKVLKDHYKPAAKAISERFKYFNRKQQPGESVTVFLSELRKQAVTCKFEKLDISLRDQFVNGLSSEAAQKRLFLEDDDLTLENAFKIGISQEVADASTLLIRGVHQLSVDPESSDYTNKVFQNYKSINKPIFVKKSESDANVNQQPCGRCGYVHRFSCPAKDAECNKCHKLGHFAKCCRSFPNDKPSLEKSSGKRNCNMVKISKRDPIIEVGLIIMDHPVKMELDTGSSQTFISVDTWNKIGAPKLSNSNVKFHTYTGESFQAKGQFECNIQYNGQSVTHNMLVTDNSCLLGRDLLNKIQMDWSVIKRQCSQVNQCNISSTLESLLEEYSDVFDNNTVGTVKNFKAKIVLQDNPTPRFFKARPVPYAVREQVEAELVRMEANGVITRVEHSDWASPLVVVPKANGKIRITGDFKRRINSQLCINQYPLARVDDLMETISGGLTFSKLDGSDAFHQVEVDENCRKFLVINTHKGLYQYNVLPQGIASSPAIFQEMMDTMLHGIPKSGSFVDDVITTGSDDRAHLKNLKEILQRMRKANYRLSRPKCQFMMKSIKFLGTVVCHDGLRTDPEKVEAILSMHEPINVSDVKSFLGLVNFYGKFIPELSSKCEPLYALTRKDSKFLWTSQCDQAFKNVKSAVSSSNLLVHFNQSLPVGITCDASSVGVGVVLFHRYPDGSERPIAYASKSLSSAERNYSQIEREALAIIIGLKKFIKYLYGRQFILVTDHNPLLGIFGQTRDVPSLAATRLHRWSLFLSGFNYAMEFRRTEKHGNADALSRLPLSGDETDNQEWDQMVKRIVEENPLTSKKVRLQTSRDPVLSKVIQFVQSGWPDKPNQVPDIIRPFYSHRHEYTVEQGIVMWGIRVIVPAILQKTILGQLHDTHTGIVRMKSLARQFVYWPGIDNDIESLVQLCHTCAINRDNPPMAPLHPWAFPEKPWQRLHIDLAGPFHKTMWLVIVDAYSKWPEIFPLGNDTTSSNVISRLRDTIARFGIPETIVSDNGPQFVSQEFESFCLNNGIRHTTSSAYHPRSNGEAERFVRTFKGALSPAECATNLNLSLNDFLLTYRITPHATTGVAPTEVMLRRKPRTLLDLFRPDPALNVNRSQEKQKERWSNTSPVRSFPIGHSVWIRTFSKNQSKWSLGQIVNVKGPLTYIVDVDQQMFKRHVDHIFDAELRKPTSTTPTTQDDDDDFLSQLAGLETPPNRQELDPQPIRRYPDRVRHPPDFYCPSN